MLFGCSWASSGWFLSTNLWLLLDGWITNLFIRWPQTVSNFFFFFLSFALHPGSSQSLGLASIQGFQFHLRIICLFFHHTISSQEMPSHSFNTCFGIFSAKFPSNLGSYELCLPWNTQMHRHLRKVPGQVVTGLAGPPWSITFSFQSKASSEWPVPPTLIGLCAPEFKG